MLGQFMLCTGSCLIVTLPQASACLWGSVSQPARKLARMRQAESGGKRTGRNLSPALASNACATMHLMRSRFARLLIAFAMALTVPLQGLAAVSAGLCMTFGHHEASDASGHSHASGAESLAEHSHEPGPGAEDGQNQAHCPPCVACCAAAAISTSDRVFVPETPVSSVVSAPPPFISGIVPDKLDRPPLAL